MEIKEILDQTDHRTWGLPDKNWQYYQEWNDALFMHWQVDIKLLRPFVPPEIEIDLFGGKAWISLVAFTMEKLRPRNLPSASTISDFHEINIRTYVRFNGKSGVYFLSIEAGKKISAFLAKKLSELPYRYSKMLRKKERYQSQNNLYQDSFNVDYKTGNSINQKSALDKWLTERYALFQDTPVFINEFHIHHVEWPIFSVNIDQMELNYKRFDTLIKGAPHLIHYSSGVQVLAWGKQKHKRNQ